jgi:hypothetical protein
MDLAARAAVVLGLSLREKSFRRARGQAVFAAQARTAIITTPA